jgi:hypothetical protein
MQDHKAYLEYLDKEMTIMGILSVFAVAASALILDKTLGADLHSEGHRLWTAQPALISLSAAALMLAALYFYRQRSALGFWYGQIVISMTARYHDVPATPALIHLTDRWSQWRHYFIAFGLITLAFSWSALVLLGWFVNLWSWTWIVAASVLIAFVLYYRIRVFEEFDKDYQPWARWRKMRWPERWFLIVLHFEQRDPGLDEYSSAYASTEIAGSCNREQPPPGVY